MLLSLLERFKQYYYVPQAVFESYLLDKIVDKGRPDLTRNEMGLEDCLVCFANYDLRLKGT